MILILSVSAFFYLLIAFIGARITINVSEVTPSRSEQAKLYALGLTWPFYLAWFFYMLIKDTANI